MSFANVWGSAWGASGSGGAVSYIFTEGIGCEIAEEDFIVEIEEEPGVDIFLDQDDIFIEVSDEE